jgi:hypothetical protein
MRVWLAGGLAVATSALGLTAHGAARLEIRGAAAHVVIIPEARADIVVTMIKANRDLPIRISRAGGVTFIDGALAHRVRGCPMLAGALGARIRGLGNVEAARLPSLVVRTPMEVRVVAGEAVSGAVGRAASVDFENRGCGAWTLANVRGRLRFSQVGSGDDRAGGAVAADLSVAGGGSVAARSVTGPLTAVSSGEGAIMVDSLVGPLIARVAGSGGVVVRAGRATQANISVAGSGAIRFGGEAGTVSASVTGSGHVSVARARGPVSRRVFGAGEVQVGR